MNNRLVIVGAGGHGKVIADIAVKNGYTDICFVDDSATGSRMGFPVKGNSTAINELNDGDTDFVIGIGNNNVRKLIAEKYDVNWVTLVHPLACISLNVTLKEGTVVMANAVINADVSVGKHCIINTSAVIEHDNVIEDYVHISPNVALGGTTRVGKLTHIGIGSSVINNVSICENCVIGAGAVVVADIEHSSTYVGVPAKEII